MDWGEKIEETQAVQRIEEKQAVGMSYSGVYMGGWVGGLIYLNEGAAADFHP